MVQDLQKQRNSSGKTHDISFCCDSPISDVLEYIMNIISAAEAKIDEMCEKIPLEDRHYGDDLDYLYHLRVLYDIGVLKSTIRKIQAILPSIDECEDVLEAWGDIRSDVCLHAAHVSTNSDFNEVYYSPAYLYFGMYLTKLVHTVKDFHHTCEKIILINDITICQI